MVLSDHRHRHGASKVLALLVHLLCDSPCKGQGNSSANTREEVYVLIGRWDVVVLAAGRHAEHTAEEVLKL